MVNICTSPVDPKGSRARSRFGERGYEPYAGLNLLRGFGDDLVGLPVQKPQLVIFAVQTPGREGRVVLVERKGREGRERGWARWHCCSWVEEQIWIIGFWTMRGMNGNG
jgi:hypothetical protein